MALSDRKLRLWALAALTLIAGWLRFTATSFGLPDQFRPDEDFIVYSALGLGKQWDPHFNNYPAGQIYVINAALSLCAGLGGGDRSFHAVYGADRGALAFLIARRISAAMGTATVPAIYFAAEPALGPNAALASAAIMAFSTIHVRDSKNAKIDAPATLWITLAIAMMLRMVYRARFPDYALAGLFSGLAAATNYPGGAVLFGILVAHLEARRRESRPLLPALLEGRLLAVGLIAACAFFCATPYFFLDWAQTLKAYRVQRRLVVHGVSPAGEGWPWLLMSAMPGSFGIGLEILLMVSIGWAIFRPRPGAYGLLAFIAFMFLVMTSFHSRMFYRYLLIPLPAMALLGGIFVADMIAIASARLGARAGAWLAVATFALILTPSFVRDLRLNRLLLQTDTRTLARRWIVEHIPPGSTLATTPWVGNLYGKPQLPADYRYFTPNAPISDLGLLRALNVSWVVVDSFAPLSLHSPGLSDQALKALNSHATLMFDVNPVIDGAAPPVVDPNDAFYAPLLHISSMTRPGPRIRIWKLQ